MNGTINNRDLIINSTSTLEKKQKKQITNSVINLTNPKPAATTEQKMSNPVKRFYANSYSCYISFISMYTLSDLGVLSNLIGSLSLANEHYSTPTE